MATFEEFVNAYRENLQKRDEIERSLHSHLASVFSRQEHALQARFRKIHAAYALTAAGPRAPQLRVQELTGDDFEDEFDNEMEPEVRHWVALLGAALVGAAVFGTKDALDRRAETLVTGLMARLNDYSGAITRKLDATLADSYRAGDTIDQMASKASLVMQQMAGVPAALMARIETSAILSGVATIAGRLDQLAFSRMWVTQRDELVRESHNEADGQIVGLNTPFAVGDDLLDFPGDPNGSPAETANCRCFIVMLNPKNDEIAQPASE